MEESVALLAIKEEQVCASVSVALLRADDKCVFVAVFAAPQAEEMFC